MHVLLYSDLSEYHVKPRTHSGLGLSEMRVLTKKEGFASLF